MASPSSVITMTYDVTKTADSNGAVRKFTMRFPGLRAASDCDSAAVIYSVVNPYTTDLVVLRAWAVITTLDADDGDIDVGLGDDASGTNAGAEIIDSLVNTAAGVLECMATQAVTGVSRPIWKAAGTSTDSYLCVKQNGDADVSALRWGLILEVARYDDMLNSDIELGAITVA